jgi:hypothetical protein
MDVGSETTSELEVSSPRENVKSLNLRSNLHVFANIENKMQVTEKK